MHNGVVRGSKLLWVLGNYARFIRPGMVQVKCDTSPGQSFVNGVLTSAYIGSDGKFIVILVNLSQEEHRCDLGFAKQVDVYTTSAKENLRKSVQSASNVVIPARAVVTVCFDKL
jgi:hypothetical protein